MQLLLTDFTIIITGDYLQKHTRVALRKKAKCHKKRQKTSILSRRILRHLREAISTRVDTSATFDLDCVYGHLKCVLEGMPFLRKIKKGKNRVFQSRSLNSFQSI